MTVKHYTGVQGVVLYGQNPIAVSEFTFSVDRGTATHPRSGKWSDLNAPGKIKVTGTVKRIMVSSEFLKAALNAAAATGDPQTIGAGPDAIDAASAPVVDVNAQAMSNPSTIRISLAVGAGTGITAPGSATVIGTNEADEPIAELIALPVTADSRSWDTKAKFKSVGSIVYEDVVTDVSTLGGSSLAAATSYTVAAPKIFSLVGKVVDGADSVIVTFTNAWWTKAGLSFTDADKMVEEDLPFQIEDPDADLTVTGT